MSLVSKVKSFFQGDSNFAQGNYSANTEINRREFLGRLGSLAVGLTAAYLLKPSLLNAKRYNEATLDSKFKDHINIAGWKFYRKDGVYYPEEPKQTQNLLFGNFSKFLDFNDGKAILVYWDSSATKYNKRLKIPDDINDTLWCAKEINKAFIKEKGIIFPIYGLEVKDWDKDYKVRLTNAVHGYPEEGIIDWPGLTTVYKRVGFFNIRGPPLGEYEKNRLVSDTLKIFNKEFNNY